MSEASETCFDPSDDYRGVFEQTVQDIRVNEGRFFRAGGFSSGRIRIVVPAAECRGVGADHGVNGSGKDGEEEVWSAELCEVGPFPVFPVGLADYRNGESCVDQCSSEECGGK